MQVNPSMPSQGAGQPQGTEFRISANARRGDLFYVSDSVANEVYEYSLPHGKLERTLKYFASPTGLCSDSKGDVYVTNTDAYDTLEYAHGGSSPIKTLTESGYLPFDCSIDPTTGDLAVTNISGPSGRGDLVIYKKAAGKPKVYHDKKFFYYWFCSFDDRGNLFVVGADYKGVSSLAELPAHKASFTNITLDKKVTYVGLLQRDGHSMTIIVAPHYGIYRLRVSGSEGTLEARTELGRPNNVYAYDFYKAQVIGAVITRISPFHGVVNFWPYPEGGKVTKTIKGFKEPNGIAVSLASK